ncbi:MAG: amino acid adenylation domain-containing protein, partial [Flavobacterium sp.]
MEQDTLSLEHKLAQDYWFNKISGFCQNGHSAVHRSKGSDEFVDESITLRSVNYIDKVSNGNAQAAFVIHLGLLSYLISKYLRNSTNVVVSPNFDNLYSKELIGNLLYFKITVDDNLTVKEHLLSVRSEFLAVNRHKDYNTGELITKLNKFDFDVNCAKQYGFSYGYSQEIGSHIKEIPFHLAVFISDDGNQHCRVYYDSQVFKKPFIQQFLKHYLLLLDLLDNEIDRKIGDLKVLSPDEINTQLYVFNAKQNSNNFNKSVVDLFKDMVKRSPHSIALVSDSGSMTYGELHQASNQLAHYLKDKFLIKPDDLVGIILKKSSELIVAILGILKAGAAYLPIDPIYPRERIQFMIDNSALSICFIDDSSKIELGCETIIDFSKGLEFLLKESTSDILSQRHGHELIYVIYTSGSTGVPKGAMVKHDSFLNLVTWYLRTLNIDENDRVLLLAPISFDLAQKNIFAPLLAGARLYLSEKVYGKYSDIVDLISEESITMINLAPSAFYPLLDPIVNNNFNKLSGLVKVILGGESIQKKIIKNWTKSKYYNANVINSYGPTECTDVVSYYAIPNDSWDTNEDIPIGRPIENLALYILDENKSLLPIGVAGDIYIGGAGLGRGYLNDTNYTNEKFQKSPFNAQELLYSSGDVGKWNFDGTIEFIGRYDDQIKIRGFRVDLAEVEKALIDYPTVKNSVVVARENINDKSKYLVGYYISEASNLTAEMRDYLRDRLPEHMIPTFLIQ